MIKSFDKSNLRTLRSEMEVALAQVAAKYGIKIQVGNARFTPSNTTFKVELSTTSTDGTVNTKAVVDFNRSCSLYGLKPEHLGATITYGHERYRLDGMAGRKTVKYVFAVTRVRDGKQFRLPLEAVRELQSKDHKMSSLGKCSNPFNFTQDTAIKQCTADATTFRKVGSRMKPLCKSCADLHDDARREMAAEARMS